MFATSRPASYRCFGRRRRRSRCSFAPARAVGAKILGLIGILIFVDEEIFEALLIKFEHGRGAGLEDREHVEQQVAEIAGVQCLQPLLVSRVERSALAVGIGFALAGIDLARLPATVLPAVDIAGERPRRPPLLVDVGGGNELLQEPKLIVGVEDGEVGLETGQLRVAPKHLGADGVEGAEPGHPLHRIADDPADPLLHLARGLVGEGDGEDLGRPGAAGGDEVREPGGERRGSCPSRAGEHQHRPFGRQHRLALRLVEAAQIAGFRHRGLGKTHPEQVGNAARLGNRVQARARRSMLPRR
jgi:hypothetical protein